MQVVRVPYGTARWPVRGLFVGLSLALSACGGGGGDDAPGGGNFPVPPLAALAGDWVQKGCVRAGTQSFKKFLRVRITSQNTLEQGEGVQTFNGTDCVGTPLLVGPTQQGVVTIARSEANQSLAVHWGVFLPFTGTRSGAIWTLRSGTQLCLLGDGIPTLLPSLSAVSQRLSTVPVSNCFARVNP